MEKGGGIYKSRLYNAVLTMATSRLPADMMKLMHPFKVPTAEAGMK